MGKSLQCCGVVPGMVLYIVYNVVVYIFILSFVFIKWSLLGIICSLLGTVVCMVPVSSTMQ